MEPANVSRESMLAAEQAIAARALVVAADERYRERAATVVGEVADVTFALAAPTSADDVAWLVEQSRADVVVLDATGCEADVARVIARLATVAPRLGVVIVCEHLTAAAQALDALPKWGWRRELRTAVLRAYADGSPLVRPAALSQSDRGDLRGVTPGRALRR